MTIINRERYYCSAKRERGTCESNIGIGAAELETRVLDGLRDILLDQDELIEVFVTEFKVEVERLRKQRCTGERQAQKALNKINKAITRCLKFITEGDGDPGLVRDELRDLEVRKRDLERALASTRDEEMIALHPNMAELYRRKVAELQSLLTDETARPQAMDIIRTMIDRIEVHASLERGNPDVILVGALAQIITFTQQKQNAASYGNGCRVLMVAGARYQRCLHLDYAYL